MRIRFASLALLLAIILAPASSYAGHHLWRFTEIFSNASGDTQFVELFVPEAGENGVGPFTVTAGSNVFSFVNSLPAASSTLNTWILIATPNFASLPGAVAPDYILPAHFFAPGGGTLNYAGVDVWNYGAVPTDGIHSLLKTGATAVNSPTNFAGQTGSVSITTPVPATRSAGIALLIGMLLLVGSGLLRRRKITTTA